MWKHMTIKQLYWRVYWKLLWTPPGGLGVPTDIGGLNVSTQLQVSEIRCTVFIIMIIITQHIQDPLFQTKCDHLGATIKTRLRWTDLCGQDFRLKALGALSLMPLIHLFWDLYYFPHTWDKRVRFPYWLFYSQRQHTLLLIFLYYICSPTFHTITRHQPPGDREGTASICAPRSPNTPKAGNVDYVFEHRKEWTTQFLAVFWTSQCI